MTGHRITALAVGAILLLSGCVTPAPPDRVIYVDAGSDGTCALKASGRVLCWGGPSGRGEPIDGIPSAIDIAVGAEFACALSGTGHAWCWGANHVGQLGNGSTTDSLTPVQVEGLEGAISIEAGWAHACAVRRSGDVVCWGYSVPGSTSIAFELPYSPVPLEVPGVTEATSVAPGVEHTCALTEAATVQCWGGGEVGQLGHGEFEHVEVAVDVVGISDARSISAGHDHTCALLADSTVWCWGTVTDSPPYVASPTDLLGWTGASAISSGEMSVCAIVGDEVRCAGSQQLRGVFDLEMETLSVGMGYWCGLTEAGTVLCGPSGQVIDGLD